MEKKVCQQYREKVVVALCFLIIVFCDVGAFICIDKPIRVCGLLKAYYGPELSGVGSV